MGRADFWRGWAFSRSVDRALRSASRCSRFEVRSWKEVGSLFLRWRVTCAWRIAYAPHGQECPCSFQGRPEGQKLAELQCACRKAERARRGKTRLQMGRRARPSRVGSPEGCVRGRVWRRKRAFRLSFGFSKGDGASRLIKMSKNKTWMNQGCSRNGSGCVYVCM